MQITERLTQDVVILDLTGRLTMGEGAELLRDRVASVVSQGHPKVLLNLAGVPYVDSGGLGELVRCSVSAQRASGAVKLMGLTTRITDLLAITKLLNVFETFETEQEAIASYMAPA